MPNDLTILRFSAEIPREHFSKKAVLGLLGELAARLDSGELSVEDFIQDTVETDLELVDILFEPTEDTGLLEAEDLSGRAVSVGEWVDLGDGYLRLRLPVAAAKVNHDPDGDLPTA
jgi:hypothetical protein